MRRQCLPVVLATLCLVLGGCREHNEPAKPIADLSSASVIAAAPAR